MRSFPCWPVVVLPTLRLLEIDLINKHHNILWKRKKHHGFPTIMYHVYYVFFDTLKINGMCTNDVFHTFIVTSKFSSQSVMTSKESLSGSTSWMIVGKLRMDTASKLTKSRSWDVITLTYGEVKVVCVNWVKSLSIWPIVATKNELCGVFFYFDVPFGGQLAIMIVWRPMT